MVHKDCRTDPAWLPAAVHDAIAFLHVVPIPHPVTVANGILCEEGISYLSPLGTVAVGVSSALQRLVAHSKRFMFPGGCRHRVGGKVLLGLTWGL